MLDTHGRNIDYLRISITDRCNLRCTYCMPKEGVKTIPKENILSIEEIFRIVKICSELGISKIRLTGGEPLVRAGVIDLIRNINTLPNINEICLTTNGLLLEQQIHSLVSSGLNRVNISLDTLKEDLYKEITRGGDLKKVLKAIGLATNANLKVKLNTVIIRDYNQDEIMDFVNLTESNSIDVRFIELMPIGEGKKLKSISTNEIKNIISKNATITPIKDKKIEDGPATYFKTKKGIGKIGFISPISHSFCENCNRIRLTAEGFLKQCLHWNYGTDLKHLIRENISDAELKKVIENCIYNKPSQHKFKENTTHSDVRFMSQIGG